LSSNDPNAIASGTVIPLDKPLSQAPAHNSMAFLLPPSMKVEVLPLFLSSAHVSKIFTFQIFYSTYIHRNSLIQKNVRRRNWSLAPRGARATDFREKKSSASSIRIVIYCKYDMYFNTYDMYSIVGIDKKL
jgi:hypothetical protein